MKVLAVIPARGGSKRLKNKNILPLNGKPLIHYSIADARRSRYIDKVIVSTDSEKIASVARRCGAEVPFMRPKSISGDRVSDYPVLTHAVLWLEEHQGFHPDIIVLLRPTVPLRAKGLIDKCIETLIKTGADSVRTMRPVGRYHPYWMVRLDKNNFAHSFIKGKTIEKYYQKQLLPELYEHDGYCDAVKRANIKDTYSGKDTLKGMYGKRIAAVMNDDDVLVNIDTRTDFSLAEFIMRKAG